MAVRFDDLLVGSDLLDNLGILHAVGSGLCNLQLAFVESFSLHLPLCLQGCHNVLVLPTDLHIDHVISRIETNLNINLQQANAGTAY